MTTRPTEGCRVTRRESHDRLSLKLSWPDGWGRIKISRRGDTIEADTKAAFERIQELWRSTSGKYGERFDAIVQEVSE